MTNRPFIAYRGRFAPYDFIYLKKYRPNQNVTLVEELVDEHTEFDMPYPILSVDTIYYPGVLECIKK